MRQKLSLGFYLKSCGLGDSLDSLRIFLFLDHFSGIDYCFKPPDRNHPYGHFRAETIIHRFLPLLCFIGGQLVLSSIDGFKP